MSEPLYDTDEIATTDDLNAVALGSVVVTHQGEGCAWIKVGATSWARPASQYRLSKCRVSHWFVMKSPVIVWEPPEDES